MPQVERRSFRLEYRVETDDEGQKRISWYPALFDVLSEDLGGFRERISRRAFTKTLQENDIRALVNHDANQILGRSSAGSLSLHVDLRGLHADTALPNTTYANDLVENIGNGNVSGGSFAFQVVKDSVAMEEDNLLIRTLHEVRLYDVSLVAFPAYPDTEGSASVRSAFAAVGIDPEPITRTLIRSRAGLPLDQEESKEVRSIIERLQTLTEPRSEEAKHSAPLMEIYKLRLELSSRSL